MSSTYVDALEASTSNIDDSDVLGDPIVSSELGGAGLSVSRSRVGWEEQPSVRVLDENEPLLGGDGRKQKKKPFYRPRPLWIVPFAILASIARGMTIAPRVQVFTQLSCNAVFGHPSDYNHTHIIPLSSTPNLTDFAVPHIYDVMEDPEIEDPLREPSKRCLADPRVQAGAARLQTIMMVTMGILSAFTTGWWGRFGERHGRTRVLTAATFGLLFTDLAFILISLPQSPFAAHGHKLLIVVPIIEGLLGGWSTLQGATSAYVSDCTSDGSRAHIFSRFMGVYYTGFALGPMLGAWLITHPLPLPSILLPESSSVHTVTPVFYVALMCSSINLFLSLFIFPESLNKEKRKARKILDAEASALILRSGSKYKGGVLALVRSLFVPLLVFAPKKRASGRDWNMLLLGLALFGYLLSAGIFQVKYLYAEHVFGWETEQLSYYITTVGGTRAVNLLFVMPFIIGLSKPKASTPPAKQGTGNGKKAKPTKSQLVAEMQYDLFITRLSFVLDLLSHGLVSVSSTASSGSAQAAFVAFTMLSSFASGVVPTMQSLALCYMQVDALETQTDGGMGGQSTANAAHANTGSLFGALAVLQATGQMILGPLIFGLLFSTTVASFPKGIFVLAASIVLVSLVLLAFVRPHMGIATDVRNRQKQKMKASNLDSDSATGSGGGGGGGVSASSGVAGNTSSGKRSRREAERGRPRTSKLLSDSSQGLYPEPESDSWASESGRGGTGAGAPVLAGEGEVRERSTHDV